MKSNEKTSPHYLYDDVGPHVRAAFDHFALIGGATGEGAPPLNPDIQDSDGLVSYIVAATNQPPAHIKELYEEIQVVMQGLTNVVVSAAIKKAGSDAAKKHDPTTWRGPMQAMVKAFCSGYSETTRSYEQRIRGVEVASKFINILIDAVVSKGAALSDFTKFLQSQGETISIEVSQGQDSYLYAAVTIVHELFQAADERWIYVPKFKSYFTRFSRETLKLTTSCASAAEFQFKFDLDIMTGAFMVASWQNVPEFRKAVQEFIQRFRQTNIKDSTNYFERIFESSFSTT